VSRQNQIDMKTIVSALILLAFASILHADQTIADAQQMLKDQGFYYGEVTGQTNSNTTAAIRRYQIRNGLEVTGELNDETMRALGIGNSSQMTAKATPSPKQETDSSRNESQEETAAVATPAEHSSPEPEEREPVYQRQPEAASAEEPPLFAGTPYQAAPPEVQHNIVISAQRSLAAQGLYQGEIDGIYGPNTEFSLRAYQARVKIRVTGRLDLETLAALRLLPGANTPVYTPRYRVFPSRPVRGVWVPQ
jgi:peptidoglycan hydrolase-like protein with peptidoglycan-binding domain